MGRNGNQAVRALAIEAIAGLFASYLRAACDGGPEHGASARAVRDAVEVVAAGATAMPTIGKNYMDSPVAAPTPSWRSPRPAVSEGVQRFALLQPQIFSVLHDVDMTSA